MPLWLWLLLLALVWSAQTLFHPMPPPKLRFSHGSFRILQLTDLHFTSPADSSMLRSLQFIERMLLWERPDLVVFTGDIISGRSLRFPDMHMTDAAFVWDRLAELMHQHNQPWVSTFGNHLGDVDRLQLGAYDSGFRLSYSQTSHVAGEYQPSVIDLFARSPHGMRRSERVARVYIFDSGDLYCEGRGGWGCINGPQREWYRAMAQEAAISRAGSPLPAIAFYHIPHDAYLSMWNSKGGFGNKYSPIGCGSDSGTIHNMFRETGDVKAIFVGHDHYNDFCGTYEGILLCYGLKSGYEDDYRTDFATGTDWMGARMVRLDLQPAGPGPPTVHISTWRRLSNGTVLDQTHEQIMRPKTKQSGCKDANSFHFYVTPLCLVPGLVLSIALWRLVKSILVRVQALRWACRRCSRKFMLAGLISMIISIVAFHIAILPRPTASFEEPQPLRWYQKTPLPPEFQSLPLEAACSSTGSLPATLPIGPEVRSIPVIPPFSHVGPDGTVLLQCPEVDHSGQPTHTGARRCVESLPRPARGLPISVPMRRLPGTTYSIGHVEAECVSVHCGLLQNWHYRPHRRSSVVARAQAVTKHLSNGNRPLDVILLLLSTSSLADFTSRLPRLAWALHHLSHRQGGHMLLHTFPYFSISRSGGMPLGDYRDPTSAAMWEYARGLGYSIFRGGTFCPSRDGMTPPIQDDPLVDMSVQVPACEGDNIRADHPLTVMDAFWEAYEELPHFAVLDLGRLTEMENVEGPLLLWLKKRHASGSLNNTALLFASSPPESASAVAHGGFLSLALPQWLCDPMAQATLQANQCRVVSPQDVGQTLKWLLGRHHGGLPGPPDSPSGVVLFHQNISLDRSCHKDR